eukprot:SAG11_NODE_35024_length_268_cov_8.715976_1_plen_48_part_01
MHGTFACHAPRAVARASDTHNPQCQKATFQVTLRWAQMCFDDSHASKA